MAPATPPHDVPSTAPLGIESVAFATGQGRLVRRANAVLFDPTGSNPKLTSAFDDASDDDAAVARVLDAVIEAELDVAPFAIVRWAADLELLVFGDIELTTSVRSAPSINGRSSGTWVEHRVARSLIDRGPSLQVWSGEQAEPDTNLRLGIAACAGFRLDLVVETGTEPATEAPAEVEVAPVVAHARPATLETPAVDVTPIQSPSPVEAIEVVEPFEIDGPSEIAEPARAESFPPPAVAAEPVPGDATPSLLEFDDPAPAPKADPEPASSIQVWTNDDDDTDADPFALVDSEPGVGVETHASAATSTAELLEFDGAAPTPSATPTATLETEPAVATLVFDDHPDLIVTSAAVVGRRPSGGDDQTALVVDHPEVSRTHAEILVVPSPAIRDLGSRNGTWVQPPDGTGLRRLTEGELAPLVAGTIVHLGSVEICFTWQPADAD